MSKFSQYCTNCVSCGNATSKSFAKQHNGQCKACMTGVPKHVCPDCGGPLSDYNFRHHYHCNACTRAADPIGYYNEVMYGD